MYERNDIQCDIRREKQSEYSKKTVKKAQKEANNFISGAL